VASCGPKASVLAIVVKVKTSSKLLAIYLELELCFGHVINFPYACR